MLTPSAGILLFRREGGTVEVLIAHPGGPFWANKDKWLLTKGVVKEGEDLLRAAKREFREETGCPVPSGELINLGNAKGGDKLNHMWALEGEVDMSKFHSNTFSMEWPPKSGKLQEFPETDRIAWFDLPTAKAKLFKTQGVFIDRLAQYLGLSPVESAQVSLF